MHRIGALVFAVRGVGDRGERRVTSVSEPVITTASAKLSPAPPPIVAWAAAERKLAVLDINRGRERVGVIIAASVVDTDPVQQRRGVLRRGAGTGAGVQDRRLATPATVTVAVTGVAVGQTLSTSAASSVESAVKCTVSVPSYSPVRV